MTVANTPKKQNISFQIKLSSQPARNRVNLSVQGMTCASCVRRVERALEKVEGVKKTVVNLVTEQAQVEYNPTKTNTDRLIAAIEQAGYEASLAQSQSNVQAQKVAHAEEAKLTLILALILCVPLFVISMGSMLTYAVGWTATPTWLAGQHWVEAVLATLILWWPGLSILRGAVKEIRTLSPAMNTLVALGAFTSWCYSLLVLLFPSWFPQGAQHVYFEASGVIITLVLVGRFIEDRAKGHATDAIHALLALRPKTALLVEGERIRETPIEHLMIGDILRIRAGDAIPIDGELIEGKAHINESMITGEAKPVYRQPGDRLIGATINQNGTLLMRVTRTSEQTVLASIIRLVENAQLDKPKVQQLADRIAGIFVPAVIAVAVLTLILWLIFSGDSSRALMAAVSVLLIACPCAMGLATPMAVMVASGRAAELGVLFRQGSTFETLASIDHMVFDKTGTLTQGRPQLAKIKAWNISQEEALGLAAGLEQQSNHPIAQAILRAATEKQIPLSPLVKVEAVAGKGLVGELGDKQVIIGSPRLIGDAKLTKDTVVPEEARTTLSAHEEAGLTPVILIVDHYLCAVFAIADQARPEASQALALLQQDGIELTMMSGDVDEVAKLQGEQLAIQDIRANMLPEDKFKALQSLQVKGHRVAFVGDGINDAPALAEADLGIAMGSGTDVALEIGDMVLIRNDLTMIPLARNLAKQTMAVIRQNFFWAYAYNVVLIPIAAGLFYPLLGWQLNPMLAAAAMAISSLVVVFNSLRLNRFARNSEY